MKKSNELNSASARNDLRVEQFTMDDGEVIEITRGSGNVFADLGLPEAEELFYKARLAHDIATIIKRRKLTQQAASELVGLRQPDLSKLLRGHTERFSVERLFVILNRLGHNVEVRVAKRAVRTGTAHIIVA